MINKESNEETNRFYKAQHHENHLNKKIQTIWNFHLATYLIKNMPFQESYLPPTFCQIIYQKKVEDIFKLPIFDEICAHLNNWRIFTIILGCRRRHDNGMITPIGIFIDQNAKNQIISHFTNMIHIKKECDENQNKYILKLQENKEIYFEFVPVGELYDENNKQRIYRLIDGLFIVKITIIPNLQRKYYCFTNTIYNKRLYICKYEQVQQQLNIKSLNMKCGYASVGIHTQIQLTKSIINKKLHLHQFGNNKLNIQNRFPLIDIPTQTQYCSIAHIYCNNKITLESIEKQHKLKLISSNVIKNHSGMIQIFYDQTVSNVNKVSFPECGNKGNKIFVLFVSRFLIVQGLIQNKVLEELRNYLVKKQSKDKVFKDSWEGQGNTLLIFNLLSTASLAGIFFSSKKYTIKYQNFLINHPK